MGWPARATVPAGVVGYVPGAWDLFHVGHLAILQRASELCDHLIVGVGTDEYLQNAKGGRPVIPFEERLAIVASMGMVERAVPDTSADKTVAWNALHFDVLFKGDDWKNTAKGDRLAAQLALVGARLVYFPYTERTSSTVLREHVARLSA